MTIRGPHRTRDHPDRCFECQRAIVVARLNELMRDAQQAGWNKAEVLAAIIDVADAKIIEDARQYTIIRRIGAQKIDEETDELPLTLFSLAPLKLSALAGQSGEEDS